MKETRIIYLNENDRPKIEKPLGLIEWFGNNYAEDWFELGWREQTDASMDWLQYRLDFKENDKPIEFNEKSHARLDMDLVVVENGGAWFNLFWDGEFQCRRIGKLNNGNL
jgi:hypothetical protein